MKQVIPASMQPNARAIEGRETAMGRIHVVTDARAVGNDAADLAFPGMAVTIDHSRDQYPVSCIDNDRVAILRRRAEVRSDSGNFLAFD